MKKIEFDDSRKLFGAIFMTKTFDSFLISEAIIDLGYEVTVTGRLKTEASPVSEVAAVSEETRYSVCEDTISWGTVREFINGLLPREGAPKKVKLVFKAPRSQFSKFIESNGLAEDNVEILDMFINVHYENDSAWCASGISVSNAMNKSCAIKWDEKVEAFLARYGGTVTA